MIKRFNQFKKLINESFDVITDALMDNIDALEVSPIDVLKFDITKYKIDDLNKNDGFIQALTQMGLKNDDVESMNDYETYINKSYKFMLLRETNAPDIESPLYLISQMNNDVCKMYKINGNFNIFYDKLSSKTIQINSNSEIYTYHTDNGSEWNLIDGEPNDIFVKYLRNDSFMQLISNDNFDIEII